MIVLIPWGVLAAMSLWWGIHDGDWGTARWIWGLLALWLVLVAYQQRRERGSDEGLRQRALTLHMAEELAVLRMVEEGAVDHAPQWATGLLARASELADKDTADLLESIREVEGPSAGVAQIEAERARWHSDYERGYRVALVQQRAEQVYPEGRIVRGL